MQTPSTLSNDEQLIQRARDIVADKFIEIESARQNKPSNFATFAKWGQHIDDYSQFMREGSYDDDIAVVSTLAALRAAVQS